MRHPCSCRPPAFEGQGLSIAEALVHGCPVVAYDVRYGPRDLLADGDEFSCRSRPRRARGRHGGAADHVELARSAHRRSGCSRARGASRACDGRARGRGRRRVGAALPPGLSRACGLSSAPGWSRATGAQAAQRSAGAELPGARIRGGARWAARGGSDGRILRWRRGRRRELFHQRVLVLDGPAARRRQRHPDRDPVARAAGPPTTGHPTSHCGSSSPGGSRCPRCSRSAT